MSLDSHSPPTTRELRFHDVCVKENDRYGGSWSLVALGGLIRTESHNTPSPCPRELYRHCLQRWHIVYRDGILSTELVYCLQKWHSVHRDGILQPLVLPALQAMGQYDNARPPSSTCGGSKSPERTGQHVRSPDLKHREHLLDVLGRRMPASHAPSYDLNQMFQILQQEWQLSDPSGN